MYRYACIYNVAALFPLGDGGCNMTDSNRGDVRGALRRWDQYTDSRANRASLSRLEVDCGKTCRDRDTDIDIDLDR